jgi:hypothetical protein
MGRFCQRLCIDDVFFVSENVDSNSVRNHHRETKATLALNAMTVEYVFQTKKWLCQYVLRTIVKIGSAYFQEHAVDFLRQRYI